MNYNVNGLIMDNLLSKAVNDYVRWMYIKFINNSGMQLTVTRTLSFELLLTFSVLIFDL